MDVLPTLIVPQEPLHEQRGWVEMTYRRPKRRLKHLSVTRYRIDCCV